MSHLKAHIIFLVIVGLYLLPQFSKAQDNIKFGMKTGYVLASTIYDNNVGFIGPYDPRCPTPPNAGIQYYEPSFLIGLNSQFLMYNTYIIGVDINYFKTTKLHEFCLRQGFSNHWLNVDLTFKASPNQPKLNPYFVMGPGFRFILNHSYNVMIYKELEAKNFSDRISLDLIVGIGLDINTKLSFEIQYVSGIASKYRYIQPYENQDTYFSNRDRFFSFNLIYYIINSN